MITNDDVEKNMGLVHMCAKKYANRGIDYEDLVQTGCLGLVKALQRFDPEKGFAFSTYAIPIINGEIRRNFREGRNIHISRPIQVRMCVIARELAKNKDVSTKTLAEKLQCKKELVIEARQALQPLVSLSQPTHNDYSENQMDIPVESCEETMAERIDLENGIKKLKPQEQRIIFLRYFKNKSQMEVSAIIGESQASVSRKEQKAIKKLKEFLLCS